MESSFVCADDTFESTTFFVRFEHKILIKTLDCFAKYWSKPNKNN